MGYPKPFSTPGFEEPPSPEGQLLAILLILFFVVLFLLRLPLWGVGCFVW